MLTFQDIYEEAQAQIQDESDNTLVSIKRAINQGAKQFMAILNREWTHEYRTFSTVVDQTFYQMPEDCIRVSTLKVLVGNVEYELTEVDETTWNKLNQSTQSSDVPEFFFIKGSDLFGIYPTPASVNVGTISYEGKMRDMSQANYTAGSVTVTEGSASVVGAGTTFNANMVGRSFKLADPLGDGMWYRITGFTGTTDLTLENNYGGLGGSNLTYAIGEIPRIPEEYHESLIDYACYRLYKRRRDWKAAQEMKSTYIEALAACQANYSSKTSSQYIKPVRIRHAGYAHVRRDQRVI